MKFFLPLLLFLTLWVSSAFAQSSSGIVFEEATFASLLTQAKAEDKLIFIDAYTTWCGPCKMMTAKVFPDSAVGEVYNARFINAKFDMEEGEGPGLAQRYSVAAYPTYLFVNGDGELVHKGIGYIPKPALLELADVAVSDASLYALGQRYAAGQRDPAFVMQYAQVLTRNYEAQRADEVVEGYLDGQADWSTDENLALLLASPGAVGDKRMVYLTEHADEIESRLGSGTVVNPLQRVLVNTYHNAHQKRSLVEPRELSAYYRQHGGPIADRLIEHYALTYYEREDKMDEYLPAALAYYTAYPSDDYTELNSLAWTFYEGTDDPAQLAQAIEWAEQSVAIRAYYPNLDTLAWLYKKVGQDKKARATALLAIEAAKAEELDYSATEKILE